MCYPAEAVGLEAKNGPADPAHDMGKFRNIVVGKRIGDFLAQKQDQHQDESERDPALLQVDDRAEQNHHKYHPAGPEQPSVEEKNIEHSGDEGRYQNHEKQIARTIFFFQHWPQEQDKGKIAHEVVPVTMTDHVGEKPEKVNWMKADFTVDSKIGHYVYARTGLQEQHKSAQKSIGEHYRRIILDAHGRKLWHENINYRPKATLLPRHTQQKTGYRSPNH